MKTLSIIFIALLFVSCKSEQINIRPTPSLTYSTGKNSYQIDVDGTLRNFHVFVPGAYDSTSPTPLVFMFHGSGGNGNNVYNTSGWREVAEQNNFICVFPTALEYFVVDLNKNQTKWSSGGLEGEIDSTATIEDDIPFVLDMLELLDATFRLDSSRIYASGFSNGGGFVKSRIMCELSDKFAAVATAGGHGLPVFVPVVSTDLISLHTLMGNEDKKKLESANRTDPFPMNDSLVMGDSHLRPDIDNILEMLELDSLYAVETSFPHFNKMNFRSSLISNRNEFRFLMVNEMGHIWPNGNNHPSGLSAPALFWKFFGEHHK